MSVPIRAPRRGIVLRLMTAMAVALVLLTLTVRAPASAGPAAGLCSMNTSRGAVPANFGLEACVNGTAIIVRNQLSVPVRVRVSGSSGQLVTVSSNMSAANLVTRARYPDPVVMLPGDLIRVPIGDNQASLSLVDTEAGGFYALTSTLAAFLPLGAGVKVYGTLADGISEMLDANVKYQNCMANANWLAQIGCATARTASITWSFGKMVVVGVAKGAISVVLDFANWASFIDKQVPSVTAIKNSERTLTQRPVTSNVPRGNQGGSTKPPAPKPVPAPNNPRIDLARGGTAPHGWWYSVVLSGFSPGSSVTVTCRDSVDPGGFWNQTFTIGGDGRASDSTLCYSADGPDHWVTGGGAESNHVTWGGPAPSTPRIDLARGGTAPHGWWYSVLLSGFSPGSSVTVTCRDSVDPGGFWNQTFTIGGDGRASDSTLCYSADGPDHWVTGGGAESNHVTW